MRRAAARRREASSGVRDCRQELRVTGVCPYYPSHMAVNHVVWIKFAAEVSPTRVREHVEALRRLKEEIPDISRLSVGENFTDRAQGCTHGLVVELPDRAALANYLAHARHVEVAKALRLDGEIWALDYEF